MTQTKTPTEKIKEIQEKIKNGSIKENIDSVLCNITFLEGYKEGYEDGKKSSEVQFYGLSYEDGVKEERNRIRELMKKFSKKFKFVGNEGQPLTYHKSFIDLEIKEILSALDEKELEK